MFMLLGLRTAPGVRHDGLCIVLAARTGVAIAADAISPTLLSFEN